MARISEAGDQSQLNAALKEGIETIDRTQIVTFTKYVRVILPLDGYVFWLKADIVSPSALINASAINSAGVDQPPRIVTPAPTIQVRGSLHYSTTRRQEQDEVFDQNQVVFTAEQDLDPFNEAGPAVLYIAQFDGLQFAFSQRRPLYVQAGIYHYVGDVVYPAMATQIVNTRDGFDTADVVVSNSLPIWLALNQYMPVFPSFLLPPNTLPPYATVHIAPETTGALSAAPLIDGTGSHFQLASERVKVTIYGLRNFNAMDYLDYVLQYSLDSDAIGIMNIPTVRDEKRTQLEFATLAQKKSVEFEINYYQTRARDIARQLITAAVATVV